MISFSSTVSSLQSLMFRQRTTNSMAQQLIQAEKEIATGRHADVFQALGTRAVEAMNLRASYDRIEGQVASNTFLQNRLDLMATTLDGMYEAGQEVLAMAMTNLDASSARPQFLQEAARVAFDTIAGYLNTTYNGAALYSGVDSNQKAVNPWTGVDAGTGLSPSQVLADITGGTVTDAADAAAKIAELRAAFDGTPANPDHAYGESFYNGTPLTDGTGAANPRLSASIDDGIRMDYGVQANDQGFRDLMRGLAMLASTDLTQIADGDAYEAWMTEATGAISSGVNAVLASETRIGTLQGQLEDATERLRTRSEVLGIQITEMEGVDPYEAATRLSALETQLQASYAVTARMQNLSFVNFMY